MQTIRKSSPKVTSVKCVLWTDLITVPLSAPLSPPRWLVPAFPPVPFSDIELGLRKVDGDRVSPFVAYDLEQIT